MKTPLKIALAVTGLVITLVVGAVVTVANLDPNNHKPWIAEQFRSQTGRDLTIGGEIGFTLYPWLGISVKEVAISNAQGFGAQPMLVADEAELRIKLIPILRQQYEIDTVRLYGASINLAVDEAGRNNWEDLLGDPAGTDSDSAATSSGSVPLGNILLGGVDVLNASLQLDDRAADVRYDISQLSFKTGALVYGQPIDLNISLQAAATRPQLTADVTLTGTLFYDLDSGRYDLAPLNLNSQLRGDTLPNGAAEISLNTAVNVDLDADTLSMTDLTLTALGSELHASVQGQKVSTSAAIYQSSLQLTGNDLALLFKAAEIEPLASQLASLSDRAFDLTTELTVDSGRGTADIPSLRANLLGTALEGSFQAADIQTETPSLRGKLLASGPDLPTVVEVMGQVSGGRDSPLSLAGRDLRQVSNKNFAIDAVFDANMSTGDVTVPTLDVRLLGATINGNLSAANIQTDKPVVKGKLDAAGPDLPLLMQIAGRFQGADSSLLDTATKLTALSNKAFTANAEFDADLQSGNISVPKLTASALGFLVNGKVTTRDLSEPNGTVDGSFTLSGENLRQLLTALDQQDLGEVVQSMSLQLGLSGNRSALSISPLTANLVVSGNQIPNSPATITLSAGSQLDLDQESMVVEDFTLNGLGLSVSGNVNATKIMEAPEFDGALTVPSFNLRRLLQQFNQPVPEMADTRTLETVSLGTSFSGSTTSIKLSDLDFGMDQTQLRGSFAVADFAKPDVSFDINITELDADRYLAPSSPQANSTSTSDATTEIPVQLLRDLSIKGQLAVGKLTISGLQMADVALGVNASAGDVVISPLRANLYQGSFSGSLGLNASAPLTLANVDVNLQAVALEPLLTDFMDASYVSGRGNLQFKLSASGNDTIALKSSLSGTGNIALEEGVLTGIDVAGVLAQVETLLRSRSVTDIRRGEKTAFETFSATLAITNGVVTSNDLLIKAPGIQIAGRGTLVDLSTDAIGYNLITSVDKSSATSNTKQYDIGGYSVPIACTGSISAPRCLPDTSEIVRTAVTREAERRVGNLIQRTLGTAADPQQAAPSTDGTATPDQTPPAAPENPTDQLINRTLNRILN